MDRLPLHIEYLLTRHDCVIVPGVGAFIAAESEAYIDFENGVIHPRRREISFNSSVVTDDGLLAHSIARHDGLSYEEGRRLLSSLIERMKEDLMAEGESSLGMIGKLVMDSEGLISFQPRLKSKLTEIYPAINLAKKDSETRASDNDELITTNETEETYDEGMRIIRVPADKYVFTISKRAVHAAAMLISILTIGLSLLIPINHDNEQKASVLSIEELFHTKVNVEKMKTTDTLDATIEDGDTIVANEPTLAL